MTGKRSCVDLDPDYEDISEHQAKRQRVLEQDAKKASLKKIESIIWSQFKMETENIESDVVIIDQLLNQARSMMDRLRAVAVASYYSRLQQNPGKASHTSFFPVNSIHPSVKKYLGKAPVATHVKTETVISPHKEDKNSLNSASVSEHMPHQASTNSGQSQADTPEFSSESADVIRGSRFTKKKTIVVGNVSKHITDRQREVNDHSTHKWMVYVRGPRDNPSIHSFVSKVWFFLHPSYRPNDRVEISTPPFHLTRRGWGEFPVRVQLHFWDERNKRVDIIHNLKLDRSYTGLQTLGAETVVEIELLREFPGNGHSKLHHSLFSDSCLEGTVIKEEEEDDGVEVQIGNTETCAALDVSNMRLRDECLLGWVSKEVDSDSTSYPHEITSATHETTVVTIKQEPSELITGSHSKNLKSSISYQTSDCTKGEYSMINRFKKPEPLASLGSEKGTATGRPSGDTEAIPAERNDGIKENNLHQKACLVADDASACETSSNSALFANHSLKTHPCLSSVKVSLGETTPNTVASSPLMQTAVLSKSSLQSPGTSQPSVILVSTAPRAPVVPLVNSNARMVSLLQRPQSVVVPRNVGESPRMVTAKKQPVSAISGSTLNQLHANSNLSDVNAPKVLMQVTPAGLKVINTQNPLATSAACNSLLTLKEIVVSRSTHTSKVSQPLLPPQQKVVGRPSTTAISTNSLLPPQQVVVGRPTSSATATNSFLPPQQIVIVRPPGSLSASSCLSLPQQTFLTKPVSHVPSRTESVVSGTAVNKVSLLTSPITVATSVQPSSKLPAVAARTVSLLKLNGPVQNHSKLSGSSPVTSGVVTSSLAALTPVVASSNSSKVTLVLPKSNDKPVLLNFDLSQIRAQGLMLDPVSVDKPSSLGVSLLQNQSAQGQNTKPPGQTPYLSVNSLSTLRNSSSTSLSQPPQQESTFSVVAALTRLKEANEVKQRADSQCSMPRTRKWFSPDHTLMPSSSQFSAPGDALVSVSSISVGDGQLKIKLENECFDKQSVETEKRILAWKDKKQRVPECRVSPQEPALSNLRQEDYADLRALIRAAVLKHPLIDIESDKFSRPYCAQSWEQWVSWNVGKQRAAEWTRAATVKKYIQRQLGAESKFKGEQLWTTRHIMQWCRLYGQSPHQPGGQIVSSQTCEWMSGEDDKEQLLLARKFSTLSTPVVLLSKDVEEVPDSDSDDASEIDIVSTVVPKTKVKIEKAEGEDLSGTEIFPPSEEAAFVQQTAAKIGVKFLPTLLQPDVITHTCEDMIFAAMLEFASEVLSDAFAAHVSSDKPLNTLTVPDVYQALVHMPFSTLFTNEQLGSQEEISSCNR